MPGQLKRIHFLVLLLAGVFLAPQLHCCVDVSSRTVESHACPICSTVGTAVTTPSLNLAMMPAIDRLEVLPVVVTVPAVVLRNVAPRAPPAV
jgi:hypothetical protein